MAREMKDSGIEWIGEIPSHWKLVRIKNIIEQSKDGIRIGPFGSALTNKTTGEGAYNVYSQANLIASDFSRTKNTIDDNTFFELQNYEVFPDDICLSMMGTIGKCKKVPIGIKRGIMDSHLIKIRLSVNIDSRFFEYVYDKDLGAVCFEQMQFDKKGFIMDGLNTTIVKNLYFPCPSKVEQRRIADFLDRRCAEIDRVIADTQKTIEEYKALKQSIITEAVTKGIRPNCPMKDSGVAWIGEIPNDWDYSTVGRIATVVRGASPRPAGDPRYFNGNSVPWITVAEVTKGNGKFIYETETFLTEEGAMHSRTVEAGTLLLSNSGATLGVPKITTITGCINDGSVAFYDLRVEQSYLLYVFNGLTLELRRQMQGYGQPNLNTTIVKSIWLPLPSENEQIEIVEYLDQQCAEIDRLIEKKQQLLGELENYKKSVIYEYVTGKKEKVE